jgi:hypothetical protein
VEKDVTVARLDCQRLIGQYVVVPLDLELAFEETQDGRCLLVRIGGSGKVVEEELCCLSDAQNHPVGKNGLDAGPFFDPDTITGQNRIVGLHLERLGVLFDTGEERFALDCSVEAVAVVTFLVGCGRRRKQKREGESYELSWVASAIHGHFLSLEVEATLVPGPL